MDKKELDNLIVNSLTSKWTTPKQLSAQVGVPWRILMRSMPRLALLGHLEMKLVFVKGKKSRERPQRQYRIRKLETSLFSRQMPDVSSFRILGVTRHTLSDEDTEEEAKAPGEKIIGLGYRC
jgi:hypothetical protein